MRIEKDNILIRSAVVKDAEQLNQWWNDGKVMEHAGFPNGLGDSLEDTINNINSRECKLSQLCIIEIDGNAVGELNYSIKEDGAAYPGWKICNASYQNQGYGTKIIKMLFESIFIDQSINNKFPIEKIVWDTMIENKRAQIVYENKIKARKIGMRENIWQDQSGNWRSVIDYEITREDFFNHTISQFQESDYKLFVDMFNSYFLYDLKIELEYSKIEEICSNIIEAGEKKIVFLDIVRIKNEPAGFIIYQIDSPKSDWCQKEGFGFIRELYIEKEFRGQGLAKLLVNHVERTLTDRSVKQIYLTSDNAGLFWNKLGYETTDEIGYKNEGTIYMKTI